MDLDCRPPWSNNALGRLGNALREGRSPPTSCPDYADVMLWHIELAAEVQEQIENSDFATRRIVRETSAMRVEQDLRVASRAKTEDTLVQKLQRKPNLKLNAVQDIAGVRIDADLFLSEQTQLAREIAAHFGADESSIVDLRDGAHAGYRAVHVWLRLPAGRVEVQIRTIFQSIWANAFEQAADKFGRGLRYGEAIDPPANNAEAEDLAKALPMIREASEMLTTAENEWQGYYDLEDAGQRMMSLGTLVMTKAMALGMMLISLRRAAGLPDFPTDGEEQAT